MNTTPGAPTDAQTLCPTCKAPCTTTIEPRGGDGQGWGTTDQERTRYHYAPLHPAPSSALAAPVASPEPMGKLVANATIRCRKCGEQNVIEFNSARTVTHNPYTGRRRDERDIASDPEGKLMVAPGEKLVAAPVASPEPEWMTAFDEARDVILNGRDTLESALDNDQTNAVLSVLDAYFMPHLKRGAPIAPSPPTTPPAAEPGGNCKHYEACFSGSRCQPACKLGKCAAAPSTAQGLSDAEIVKIVNQSDLRDMHEHMGWYSAPEKAFRQHALALARQIEAAILAAKETK